MIATLGPTARPMDPVPTPRPTIDLAQIPTLERQIGTADGADAPSRRDQLAHCLSYRVEPLSQPGVSGNVKTRVKVHARNGCNTGVPSDESWFEITSISNADGSTVGKEVGRFQGPIGPFATDAETLVEIDCPTNLPGGCRYSVEVWWAAGGGRGPHR